MRSTIQHVAKRAGVSPMTVSNVLRGRSGEAGADTRARVLHAVRELDYIPVRAAKQSRHVQTHVLGVVFDEIDAACDIWGLMTLRGLRQGALEQGYDLLLMLRPAPDWAVGREEAQFLDRRSDGLIFVAPNERSGVLRALVENAIPVVACFETALPQGVASVAHDNVAAGRLATEYLIGRGHRRIAFLAGYLKKTYFQERCEGYRLAMAAAGLKALTVLELANTPTAIPQASDLEKLRDLEMTAVVCGNDCHALELWRLAAVAEVRVPEELSIIGIDDISEAAGAGLTSIYLDMSDVGRNAVDSLVGLLQGQSSEQCHRKIGARIVERESVADGKFGRV